MFLKNIVISLTVHGNPLTLKFDHVSEFQSVISASGKIRNKKKFGYLGTFHTANMMDFIHVMKQSDFEKLCFLTQHFTKTTKLMVLVLTSKMTEARTRELAKFYSEKNMELIEVYDQNLNNVSPNQYG